MKRLSLVLAGLGMVCCLMVGFINGSTSPIVPHWLQYGLLYAGMILLVIGLGWDGQTINWGGLSRGELLSIMGVLALALIVRLWQLGTKVRVPVDELLPMSQILALWDNPNLPIIRQSALISSPTVMLASWQAFSVAIFGHNLLALRIPSAIIGTLTAGAVYLLGRNLFDRRIALVAALLLATYPPHVHFSRVGGINIGDPLFGTLAFACVAWAFKSNRRLAWVLAGISLGLSQYFYDAGRLVYPLLLILWMIFKLLANRSHIRQWSRGLISFGVSAAALTFPIYYTLSRLNDPLSTRMNTLSVTPASWSIILTSPPDSPTFDWLIHHLTDPFLLFINRPDPTPYYGGSTALILAILVPAFLLGLVWSLRTSGGRGLLLWFGITWAGNILLTESALAARYVIVFPAVALIMALGIVETARLLPTSQRFRLAYVYLAVCLIVQTFYYFGPHLQNYNQLFIVNHDAYDALFRAADLPAGTSVYLFNPPPNVTGDYAQTFMRFVSADKTITFVEAPDQFDFAQVPATSAAFFVPADDTADLNRIKAHFHLAAPEYPTADVPAHQAYLLYRVN